MIPDRFTLSFRVETNPLPLQSFRYAKKGGYKPARIKAYQEQIGWAAKEAMQGRSPIDVPVSVSYTLKRSDKRRVDVDNMAKAISDAMTGIVWNDDQQIIELHVYKQLGDGEVVVRVEQI